MIEMDIHTLWVWLYLSEVMFSVLLGIVWSVRRAEQALVYWAVGSLCLSVGSLGISLRGQIPDLLSIPIANVLIGLALTLRWAGLRRFAGQPLRTSAYLALPLLIGLVFQFREWLGLQVVSRIIIVALGGAVYAVLITLDGLRAQRQERLFMRQVIVGIGGIMLAFEIAMGAYNLLAGPSQHFLSQSPANATLVLIFLNIFALFDLASFLMVFERQEAQLVRRASVDSLTNVLNRAGFTDLAGRQSRRNARELRPVSVLVMDLDWFKKVNDTYGHEAGDAVLRAFAQATRVALRPTDLLARAGGEEFWALLPRSDLAEAAKVAQRVCDGFRRVRVAFDGHSIAATVSDGVTEVNAEAETIQAALSRADQALYEAKHEGRDRVVTARPALMSQHAVPA